MEAKEIAQEQCATEKLFYYDSHMQEFDAVNAANLDGGSSSCMYYKDEYLMSSVTFYYANSSWKLPLGFIVKE